MLLLLILVGEMRDLAPRRGEIRMLLLQRWWHIPEMVVYNEKAAGKRDSLSWGRGKGEGFYSWYCEETGQQSKTAP